MVMIYSNVVKILMGKKCVCCGKIFENWKNDYCSTECFQRKIDPNQTCPEDNLELT